MMVNPAIVPILAAASRSHGHLYGPPPTFMELFIALHGTVLLVFLMVKAMSAVDAGNKRAGLVFFLSGWALILLGAAWITGAL